MFYPNYNGIKISENASGSPNTS